ncbi:MAG: UDP-N-acetylglucosamine--N-acetylmuramyl-(pentapeptide) pyrophosphoryl-undecaprenol N-acetylglucosamine transferase, partial [Sphingomonadaceae bacterium]|nr:UDP-N-acetylglucosamine--N-acetylmuramyl-(pentapeptide) pyrophosphoryl-undecaprenol N-acetylglucosamine transferase [Sphingomonadaceae bacterium]
GELSRHYVIAAGGTGGHMVPASVVAGELRARGHRVTLMTDTRGLRFPGLFEGVESRVVESAVIGSPLGWPRAAATIWRGRAAARAFLKAEKVVAVIGFGGYPSLPPLLAAVSLKRPAVLHEQNAVLGRVNRLLAGRATRIATSFKPTLRLAPRYVAKTAFTGLPVRPEIAAIGSRSYPATVGTIELFVTGGSQGASILSRVVPAAIGQLPGELRTRLHVVQQCRPEDLAAVRTTYVEQGTAATCEPYFADFAARLATAHLVIGRSGASTMAELTAAGRPAILVPFAAATDDHQAANAAAFVAAGAGPMLRESAFTPDAVAREIVSLLTVPAALEKAARAARSIGHPAAGATLADLVTGLTP